MTVRDASLLNGDEGVLIPPRNFFVDYGTNHFMAITGSGKIRFKIRDYSAKPLCESPFWDLTIANSQKARHTAKGCTVDKASPRNIPERTEIWRCESGTY